MIAIHSDTGVDRAHKGVAVGKLGATVTLLLAMLSPTVTAACEVSAAAISFGPIDPQSPIATDSASEIVVTCPAPTNYSVALSSGGGSYVQRQMSSGSDLLDYQLFIDASRNTVWGDGSGGTLVVAGNAEDIGTTHYVYGRIPPQPFAIPGAYADTLVVTITY